MNIFDVRLFTLCSVIFTAITVSIILYLDVLNEKEKHQQLKIILLHYLGSQLFTSIGYICYFYFPATFIWINWLFLMFMLFIPVFFYEFIFNITTTSATEKFSRYHYWLPILLGIVMLLLSILTPLEEQHLTVAGDGRYRGDSLLFYIFSNKLYFRTIFNITYIALSFRRLSPYRKYIKNYAANETKSSLGWVTILLFFMICLMLVPLYGLFTTRSALAVSYVTYIQSGISIIQYALLTYHVVKRHYVLQEKEIPENKRIINENIHNNSFVNKPEDKLKKHTLNKKWLEDYMTKHKPYHDTNLKITDLSESMGINRTYISAFINSEYGMNFSTYINRLRFDEYETLRNNNTYLSLTNSELAEKVGFGSYRSYTRFAAKITEQSS